MRYRAVAVLLLIIVLSVIPAGAASGGYTVTSGYDHIAEGPPEDTVPVEWWQLPFRVLLANVISSYAPECLIIVNFFFLVNVWLFFGYRRVAKCAALEHETRLAIYKHIIARPGIHISALARDLGINRGTLKYHMKKLQEFGMITAASVEGHTGYFENRQRFSVLEEKLLIHLRNRTTQEILSILLESSGALRRELAGRLGIASPSISWHMHRLEADGIVEVEKCGREKRYYLTDAALSVLERHLTAAPG